MRQTVKMNVMRFVHGRLVGPGDVVEAAIAAAEVLIRTGQAGPFGPEIPAAEPPAGDEPRPKPARRKSTRKEAAP